MAGTPAAGSGARTWLGWAYEVTPGTPVAAANWLKLLPDQLTINTDPKQTVYELSNGTQFADDALVPEDGTNGGDVQFQLCGGLGQGLVFAAAFLDAVTGSGSPYTHAGALSLSKPVTLEVYRSGQSWQYSGMYATKVAIASDGKKAAKVTITFAGLGAPALIVPSTPTWTPAADQPYSWRDFQTATLLGAGANDKTIDAFELDIDLPHSAFYGNNQSGFPSDQILENVKVSGTITKLFKTTTEWAAALAVATAPSSLVFGWSKGSSNSSTITIPYAKYTMDTLKNPMKGPITETIPFVGLSPDGANPLSYVVINGVSGAYSTA